MKAILFAAAIATALSAGALSASAQNETDRAVGAGSYVHPTGPANGSWTSSSGSVGSGLVKTR